MTQQELNWSYIEQEFKDIFETYDKHNRDTVASVEPRYRPLLQQANECLPFRSSPRQVVKHYKDIHLLLDTIMYYLVVDRKPANLPNIPEGDRGSINFPINREKLEQYERYTGKKGSGFLTKYPHALTPETRALIVKMHSHQWLKDLHSLDKYAHRTGPVISITPEMVQMQQCTPFEPTRMRSSNGFEFELLNPTLIVACKKFEIDGVSYITTGMEARNDLQELMTHVRNLS